MAGWYDEYDAIVVGAGLCGGVISRHLAERNKHVLILERRGHIAGNMYDYKDSETGIFVQKYGPHTFHTQEKHLYEYMCKYGEWHECDLKGGARIDGKFTPMPFNYQTIDDFNTVEQATKIKASIAKFYPGAEHASITDMINSPDEDIRGWAQFLFDRDYSLYTAKQWGISPQEIDPSVLSRVPIVFSYREGYFTDTYQVMPRVSFTTFFERLLDHANIELRLRFDALDVLEIRDSYILLNGTKSDIPIFFTGAIDELFRGCYGKLPYRSLLFEWKVIEGQRYQPYPVVAYPQELGYTRITEYGDRDGNDNGKTVIAVEYPLQYDLNTNNEPYYPVLNSENTNLHKRYAAAAGKIPNLYLCGRLADYKYYNMDQALARALEMCEQL